MLFSRMYKESEERFHSPLPDGISRNMKTMRVLINFTTAILSSARPPHTENHIFSVIPSQTCTPIHIHDHTLRLSKINYVKHCGWANNGGCYWSHTWRWLAENIDCKPLLPCHIALSSQHALPHIPSFVTLTGPSCPKGDCINLQPRGQPLWTTATGRAIITLIPWRRSYISYKWSWGIYLSCWGKERRRELKTPMKEDNWK